MINFPFSDHTNAVADLFGFPIFSIRCCAARHAGLETFIFPIVCSWHCAFGAIVDTRYPLGNRLVPNRRQG